MHKGFWNIAHLSLEFSQIFIQKKNGSSPKKSRWRSSCANYLFFERNNLNFRDAKRWPSFANRFLRGNKVCRFFFFEPIQGIKLRWISRMVPVLPFSEMSNCRFADLSRDFVVHVYRPGNSKDEVVRKKWTYCQLLVDTLN